jgi:hypothetical protein
MATTYWLYADGNLIGHPAESREAAETRGLERVQAGAKLVMIEVMPENVLAGMWGLRFDREVNAWVCTSLPYTEAA